MPPEAGGRANQRRRTRKALVDAAAALVRQGLKPSLEEVAEAAEVSRATAYRYFSSIEALLLEASLHLVAPDRSILDDAPDDVTERVRRVDDAFQDMIVANEATLRLMLAKGLEHRATAAEADPVRQNRRTPLIEAALEPARDACDAETLDRLAQALAILIGPEAFIVTKDVLQIPDEEARALKAWAIARLIEAALQEARPARRAAR
jgi:AcrR family transcriptional regulator